MDFITSFEALAPCIGKALSEKVFADGIAVGKAEPGDVLRSQLIARAASLPEPSLRLVRRA